MAAEAKRAPLVREQIVAPAIQRGPITINSVPNALEDVSCLIERLTALLSGALGGLHDLTVSLPMAGGEISDRTVSRFYDNWMVLGVFAQQFADVDATLSAIVQAAFATKGKPDSSCTGHAEYAPAHGSAEKVVRS